MDILNSLYNGDCFIKVKRKERFGFDCDSRLSKYLPF